MKRLLILLAICLFVFTQFGIAFAKKECKDPSNYKWDPKANSGEVACIETKKMGPKCEDPSKFRWDPKSGTCIDK